MVVERRRKLILPTCDSTAASGISSKNHLSSDAQQAPAATHGDVPAARRTPRPSDGRYTTHGPHGDTPAARRTARRRPGHATTHGHAPAAQRTRRRGKDSRSDDIQRTTTPRPRGGPHGDAPTTRQTRRRGDDGRGNDVPTHGHARVSRRTARRRPGRDATPGPRDDGDLKPP